MKNLALKVQRFLKSEDGPTAVEYAVMFGAYCDRLLDRYSVDWHQRQYDV